MFTFDDFPVETYRMTAGWTDSKDRGNADKDRAERLVRSMNCAVQIDAAFVRTASESSPFFSEDLDSGMYYEAEGPLSDLLCPEFLDAYAERKKYKSSRSGRADGPVKGTAATTKTQSPPPLNRRTFVAVGGQSSGHGNSFAIVPGRKIILQLDQETYETLGLRGSALGKRSKMESRSFQIVVRFDDLPNERVSWCLKDRIGNVPLVACCTNASGSLEKVRFPSSFRVRERRMKLSSDTFAITGSPDMDKIHEGLCGERGDNEENFREGNGVSHSEKDAAAHDLQDWIGAAACRARAALETTGSMPPSADSTESYVSAYRCGNAMPCIRHTKGDCHLRVERVSGFVSHDYLARVLARARRRVDVGDVPWILLTVWSDTDSPCMWNQGGRNISNRYALRGQSPGHASIAILPNGKYIILSPAIR